MKLDVAKVKSNVELSNNLRALNREEFSMILDFLTDENPPMDILHKSKHPTHGERKVKKRGQ